jgi:ribonucleotide reductase alpha subunit
MPYTPSAVCNLASIALPTFIKNGVYDFAKLHEVVKSVAFNLNRIIDVNYYPVKEAENSNLRHRPIGIGVQGLADAFMALRYPFDSPEAKQLNLQIFETIYHAAVESSCDMAKAYKEDHPEEDGWYPSYKKNGGSPASLGQLQYDLWGVTPTDLWDWEELKAKVAVHGMRNSLVCAPMPVSVPGVHVGSNTDRAAL